VYDVNDVDPNYITEKQFGTAPFHIALKKWMSLLKKG